MPLEQKKGLSFLEYTFVRIPLVFGGEKRGSVSQSLAGAQRCCQMDMEGSGGFTDLSYLLYEGDKRMHVT